MVKSTNLHFSRCLIFVSFGNNVDIVVIMKALNGFLMTQSQMTLIWVYRKLHLPRTLDALLADIVDTVRVWSSCTTSAILRCAVHCTIS